MEERTIWRVMACPSDVQPFTIIDLQTSRWSALKELVRLCKRKGYTKDDCRHCLKTEQLILVRVNLDDCD